MSNNEKKDINKDFLLENLYHEDKLFTSRVNLFLLTESILFISFITALCTCTNFQYISIIVNIIGFSISITYLIIFFRHKINIELLDKRLRRVSNDYKILKEEIMIRGYANFSLGIVIPTIFIVSWGILLEINIKIIIC